MAGQAANERKRYAPDERRQMIVDEAAAFFSEVGLEGTTRELSQRLGVTQSLLYAYFASKADLLEAVFERVYLDRLSPDWPVLIADRSLPVRTRAQRFYREYTGAIFTYEWMRIFMFSGLAGTELNRRYLAHLAKLMLEPLCTEMRHAAGGREGPQMEDIWNLHGGIVYIGIRKFVYCVPTPDDFGPPVEAAVDRFCDSFGLG
ncbi:MAG: TetR/AcrR family transcriptional regulator [Aliihoeflea sp.]|uniref:TetR/AcrR family transcriptional regulator n=1 Tax=Aliihoeflea sp. TaxID=2608088 RepID=UPI00403346F9